jgi:hypothetical protein
MTLQHVHEGTITLPSSPFLGRKENTCVARKGRIQEFQSLLRRFVLCCLLACLWRGRVSAFAFLLLALAVDALPLALCVDTDTPIVPLPPIRTLNRVAA